MSRTPCDVSHCVLVVNKVNISYFEATVFLLPYKYTRMCYKRHARRCVTPWRRDATVLGINIATGESARCGVAVLVTSSRSFLFTVRRRPILARERVDLTTWIHRPSLNNVSLGCSCYNYIECLVKTRK